MNKLRLVCSAVGLLAFSVFAISLYLKAINEPSEDQSVDLTAGQGATRTDGKDGAVNSYDESSKIDASLEGCLDDCVVILNALNLSFDIDDLSYETMLGDAEKIAEHLKVNDVSRAEMMELAANTDDGKKRKIILAAFKHLSVQHQEEIGLFLADSPYFEQRKNGVDYLGSLDALDSPLVETLTSMLYAENEEYVRGSLINALNRPEELQGNTVVLEALYQAVQTDPDPDIRGEALLASIELLKDPQDIMTETFSAVQSSEEDYQFHGLRSLDLILNKESLDTPALSAVNKEQARDILRELVNSEYSEMSASSRSLADDIFKRHFGG